MWPWLARAAYDARSGSQPSAVRKPATSAAVGVLSATSRHRERMVGSRSSTVGAHSIQTVRGLGSSIALSSALQACSVSRSASSTIEDLPPLAHRGEGRAADQVAHLLDADRELLGAHHGDVDVAAGQHGAAVVAALRAGGSEPALLALQRRSERHRGVGPARARRSGEQPRVVHALAGDGGLELLDRCPLADQARPHGHLVLRPAWPSSGATRSRIAAAMSSTPDRASSTR